MCCGAVCKKRAAGYDDDGLVEDWSICSLRFSESLLEKLKF